MNGEIEHAKKACIFILWIENYIFSNSAPSLPDSEFNISFTNENLKKTIAGKSKNCLKICLNIKKLKLNFFGTFSNFVSFLKFF